MEDIKIHINTQILGKLDFSVYADKELWINATTEQRRLFLKLKAKDYLLDNIDDLVDDLINFDDFDV